MARYRHLPVWVIGAGCTLAFLGSTPCSVTAVEFGRDIRPILAEHCFQCHGPDDRARKAKYRLDQRESALAGGESGERGIVPGKPEASAIIRRITSINPTEQMPPPRHNKRLTEIQKVVLREWIAQGAPFDIHWAFAAPQRPLVPSGKNAIDQLVSRRLNENGLVLSTPAKAEVLCRRIYLDLIGLPPSPSEVDDFAAAAAKDRRKAVADLVDRLLASPHFGEKWARHWLDAARYADSDGYEKDLPRQQWAYRDWVVRSLNSDMRYDRFLVEQLSGDLLPNPTQDQIIATGFLRNSMINEEGAIVAEQFRMEAMFDRMDAIGKGILGLSLQCCQCHSHKYDPISQTEYYRMMAFLNDTYESQSWVYSAAQQNAIQAMHQSLAAAMARFKRERADWPQRLAEWEKVVRETRIPWQILKPQEADVVGGLAHPEIQRDGSVITLGHKVVRGELWVRAVASGRITGLRLDAMTHGDLPFNGPGRSPKGTFAMAELVVEAAPASAGGSPKWERVPLATATADISPPARPLEPPFYAARDGKPDNRTVGPVAFLIDGKDETAWCPDRGPGRRNVSSHAVVAFEKPVENPGGTQFKITFKYRHAGDDGFGRTNNFLGYFRLSTTNVINPRADVFGPDVRDALEIEPAKRTSKQQDAVFSGWLASTPAGQSLLSTMDTIWATYPEAETSVLSLAARDYRHARQTFTLERGAWDKPKQVVETGGLTILHPMPAEPRTRLTFAEWLVHRQNPLVARVFMNRVWLAIWGSGLVETAEEFGSRGSPPSNPELLDWLAVEFMDNGWSLKRMLRTILTSDVYQQSSKATPMLLEKDPKNSLHSRGPRFRPDAEVVRDMILTMSGLLNQKFGGPYVFPPVPESLLQLSYARVDFWKTSEGPDRYRRSLYLFRRRSLPDPLLSCFDAPNGDTAVVRRGRSNTPLAALAALNEPVMVEATRAMALRVLKEAGASDEQRAILAFRLCTARKPASTELEAILGLVQESRRRVADGWLAAKELLSDDGSLPPLPPGCTPADAAVWTITARTLLNLDETLTKN